MGELDKITLFTRGLVSQTLAEVVYRRKRKRVVFLIKHLANCAMLAVAKLVAKEFGAVYAVTRKRVSSISRLLKERKR
ncbi:hypothetical protein GQ600_13005 [Phytophthora cactorum]|nr:hypothetical protein GQ600_13005 [Phytophthora cactorum]